jgi:D-alanyl-D-alanine carboxypeptidase
MTQDERFARLDRSLERLCSRGKAGEVLLAVESADGQRSYRFGDGQRPFFIASATKLYVTALMARLRERGRVDWDAPFVRYLPALDTRGLHVLRGADHTERITIRQLLAHTSGLADYFEGPREDGPPTFTRVLAGDFAWTAQDVVRWTRTHQRQVFAPGVGNRASYSDTNYQLLGAILEHAHEASFAEVLARELAAPLGLDATWCFSQATLDRYDQVATMLHGRAPLRIPLAMASVGADGGVVSTLDDSLRFSRAFFGGALFSAPVLRELQAEWRRIFFPLQYGTGLMRFALPWFMSPLRRFPALVGHSGASGAMMFFCPDWGLYVAGTVNQVAQRSLSFRVALEALATVHDAAR